MNAKYWNCRINNTNHEQIEGIILGNSRVQLGITEKMLSHNFVNLGQVSMDLYTMHEILRCILEKNLPLKFLWLDLYDYNYFNFNASLSNNGLTIAKYYGIFDEHNYCNSKNKVFSYEEDLLSKAGLPILTEEELEGKSLS